MKHLPCRQSWKLNWIFPRVAESSGNNILNVSFKQILNVIKSSSLCQTDDTNVKSDTLLSAFDKMFIGANYK